MKDKEIVGIVATIILVVIMAYVLYATFSNDEPETKLVKRVVKEYTLQPALTLTSGETVIENPWGYGHQREIIYGESNYKNIIDLNKTSIIGRSLWINENGNLYPAIESDTKSLTFNKYPERMTLILEVMNENIGIDLDKLGDNKKLTVLKNVNEFGKDVLLINFLTKDYPDVSLEIPVYFHNDCLITSENPDDYFICNTLEKTRQVLGDEDLTFLNIDVLEDEEKEDRINDKLGWSDRIQWKQMCLNHKCAPILVELNETISMSDEIDTNIKQIHLYDEIKIGEKIEWIN